MDVEGVEENGNGVWDELKRVEKRFGGQRGALWRWGTAVKLGRRRSQAERKVRDGFMARWRGRFRHRSRPP